MNEERTCDLCGDVLSEGDDGYILKDGRLVCEDCFDSCCALCDECGEYVEEATLRIRGDGMRVCPDCFEIFPML